MEKWQQGKIIKINGSSVFEGELENGRVARRHANNIIPYHSFNVMMNNHVHVSESRQSVSLPNILNGKIKLYGTIVHLMLPLDKFL